MATHCEVRNSEGSQRYPCDGYGQSSFVRSRGCVREATDRRDAIESPWRISAASGGTRSLSRGAADPCAANAGGVAGDCTPALEGGILVGNVRDVR